jgi:hypothetical protein
MNNSTPRHGRRPTGRRSTRCLLPARRLKEVTRMDPQPSDHEMRQDLIDRVRQEIKDGIYDTPEKFEAALDRLAERLESD